MSDLISQNWPRTTGDVINHQRWIAGDTYFNQVQMDDFRTEWPLGETLSSRGQRAPCPSPPMGSILENYTLPTPMVALGKSNYHRFREVEFGEFSDAPSLQGRSQPTRGIF